MTTLRERYWLIAVECSFNFVVELIEHCKIDVNEQDDKGRSLLFYMISVSSCNIDVTIDFINKYKPRMDVFDKYGRTVFYRFIQMILTDYYESENVIHLIDVLLDMTSIIVLLKKDKEGAPIVEFLTKKATNLDINLKKIDKTTTTAISDEIYHLIMKNRLMKIINRINQHINRKCTLFDLMYSEYEHKINKK